MASVIKGRNWNKQKENLPCVSSRFSLFPFYIIIIVNQTVKLQLIICKFVALRQGIAQKMYKHM
jgi:hypothetical protein